MILDSIFRPLLSLSPVLSIGIISLVVAVIVTIIYKYTTNQQMMKQFKEESADTRKKLKELKGQPEKLTELNKQMMEKQMKVMMNSFKPTLFTIIPLLFIFGWMSAHYSFEAIKPGTEFTTEMVFAPGTTGTASMITPQSGLQLVGDAKKDIVNNTAEWTLKGESGDYLLEYSYSNSTYTRELLISEKQEYKPLSQIVTGNAVKELRINNPKLKVIDMFGLKLSWLWAYMIFSLVSSMVLRKLMKVY